MQKNYLVLFCSLFMLLLLKACFATEPQPKQGTPSVEKSVVTVKNQKCAKVQIQTTPNDVDTLIYVGVNSGRICQQFQKSDDDASLLTAFISSGTYSLEVWKDDYETNCLIEVKESEPHVFETTLKCPSKQEDSIRIELVNNTNTDKKDNKTGVYGDIADQNQDPNQDPNEHQNTASESQKKVPTVSNLNKKEKGVRATATDNKSNFTLEISNLKRGNSYTVQIYKTGHVSVTKGKKIATTCYSNVMPRKDVVRLDSLDCSFESQDYFTLSISHLKLGKSYTVQIYKTERVHIKGKKIATCYSNVMPRKDVVHLDSRDCSFEGKSSCNLSRHDGITEVSINYKEQQHTLKFVEIATNNAEVNIALKKAQAQMFYRKAQQMWQKKKSSSSSPLLPWILMAVSESPVKKTIQAFWIQQELISSSEKLYQAIIKKGSSEAVSYDDAILVIDKLNQWCEGKATFALPSEEQFVYLAKKLYDPANPDNPEPLVACQTLRNKDLEIFTQDNKKFLIKKLLGNKWQLTKSKCELFGLDSGDITCDNDTYVKKGGTRKSTDATECMPESRADSAPDIREPNTTFRLILIEEPKTETQDSLTQ